MFFCALERTVRLARDASLRSLWSARSGWDGAVVLLSIGGNLGEVKETFRKALELLGEGGFQMARVSSPYRNPAIGCEEGAPDFTNWAVSGHWHGTPEALLDLTQRIEVLCGRPADHPKAHSRTLDIDIVLFDSIRCQTERLQLPHPRWRERNFVKTPFQEIEPEWFEKAMED